MSKVTFTRLLEMGIKLNVSKCSFIMKEMKFLGQIIVSEKWLRPDNKNTDALQKMSPPESETGMKIYRNMSFLLETYS